MQVFIDSHVSIATLACLKKIPHRVHSQRDIWRTDPLVQLVEGVRPIGGIVSIKGVPATSKANILWA
jgi:hypothetical protein